MTYLMYFSVDLPQTQFVSTSLRRDIIRFDFVFQLGVTGALRYILCYLSYSADRYHLPSRKQPSALSTPDHMVR